jgi:hypothetical protein
MAGNPKRALKALNAAPRKVGRHEVMPATLRMCCVLDEIGSPLVIHGRPAPRNVGGWAPTIFAMTRPAAESQRLLAEGRDAFDAACMEWADGLMLDEALALVRACANQVAAAAGVHPDPGEDGETGNGERGTGNGTEDPPAATAGPSSASPPPARGSAGRRTRRSTARSGSSTCSSASRAASASAG